MTTDVHGRTVRVANLREVARQRKVRTEEAIRNAVVSLDERHVPITVAAVAKTAGVTRQTVYNSPFRKEIEALRDQTRGKSARSTVRATATEASLKQRLDLAYREIEKLREERDKLRQTLNAVLAQQRQDSRR
ncbi:DUF6262 family protein [uncultured Deinococcus sp.]|uniref:DUF6262 family protein n=1 Tax=uncultured Deinococcus sp. TaxID=158789 RepID=UPI0025CBD844|nr:DUF6262 family protein [uncultured Deinococcus sp.]